jgi:hypothetical protein
VIGHLEATRQSRPASSLLRFSLMHFNIAQGDTMWVGSTRTYQNLLDVDTHSGKVLGLMVF